MESGVAVESSVAVENELRRVGDEIQGVKATIRDLDKELKESGVPLVKRMELLDSLQQQLAGVQNQRTELLKAKNQSTSEAAGPGPGSVADAADTSREYILQCMPPMQAQNMQELYCALQAPLGRRLPVNPHQQCLLVRSDASLGVELASVKDDREVGTAHTFRDWVSVTLMRTFSSAASEMQVGHYVSLFVGDTITMLKPYFPELNIHINGDAVDRSGATGARLRPGFLCWVKNALLFKGEHKASRDDLQLAVSELGTKMATAWDPTLQPGVALPFMLAYAAAGSLLQFYAIYRAAVSGDVEVVDISPTYNLAEPIGRVAVLHATCNVFRILRGMVPQVPKVELGLGQTLTAYGSDGSTIIRTLEVYQGFIRKCIPKFVARHVTAGINDLNELKAAYEATAGNPSVIQVHTDNRCGPRLENDKYIVHLSPVGRPNHSAPSTDLDRKAAVRAVLMGLSSLHAKGLVHRDVRWPNVIRTAEGAWRLIDLEHAAFTGRSCPPVLHLCHAPGVLEAGDVFTAASDLVMVAQQLLSGAPSELADDLRQQLEARGLTAEKALQHAWFSLPPAGA